MAPTYDKNVTSWDFLTRGETKYEDAPYLDFLGDFVEEEEDAEEDYYGDPYDSSNPNICSSCGHDSDLSVSLEKETDKKTGKVKYVVSYTDELSCYEWDGCEVSPEEFLEYSKSEILEEWFTNGSGLFNTEEVKDFYATLRKIVDKG